MRLTDLVQLDSLEHGPQLGQGLLGGAAVRAVRLGEDDYIHVCQQTFMDQDHDQGHPHAPHRQAMGRRVRRPEASSRTDRIVVDDLLDFLGSVCHGAGACGSGEEVAEEVHGVWRREQ